LGSAQRFRPNRERALNASFRDRFFGWVGAAIVATALLWIAWVSVHILWYRSHPPRETAFMAQRMDEARARDPKAQLKYQWVPYERISLNLKRAMIAAEDATFAAHGGFDWHGIQNAPREESKKRSCGERRIDDHTAAREESFSDAGQKLLAQGRGGDRDAAARSDAAQSGGFWSSISM
jgi:hypothetical protein